MDFLEQVKSNFRRKIQILDSLKEKRSSIWTNQLLELLGKTCKQCFSKENMRSWRRGKNGGGEYLLDFTFVEWEEMPFSGKILFPHRVIVACESEWGKQNSPKDTYEMVKDDFCKLLDFKSQYKIMIYGYKLSKPEYLLDLKEMFSTFFIRRNENGWDDPLVNEEWLFIGVPWDGKPGECVFYRKYAGVLELSELPE